MNKRNQVIIVLALILTTIIVLLLGIILFIKIKSINKLNNVYEDIYDDTKENVYSQEETQNVIEFLKSGTGIVFFEMKDCKWCKSAKPIFKEALQEIDFEIDNIIYYNPYYIRKNNTDEYKEIVNILKPILGTDDNGNKKLFVPEVVFLKDGKIVAHKTNNVDTYTNPEIEMTEKQVEELRNIYITFMYRLKDESGCQNCN